MVWCGYLCFVIPSGIFSMSQEFLEIWAEVPLNPDHSRSGFVPYKYRAICPSAGLGRFGGPSASFIEPVG